MRRIREGTSRPRRNLVLPDACLTSSIAQCHAQRPPARAPPRRRGPADRRRDRLRRHHAHRWRSIAALAGPGRGDRRAGAPVTTKPATTHVATVAASKAASVKKVHVAKTSVKPVVKPKVHPAIPAPRTTPVAILNGGTAQGAAAALAARLRSLGYPVPRRRQRRPPRFCRWRSSTPRASGRPPGRRAPRRPGAVRHAARGPETGTSRVPGCS